MRLQRNQGETILLIHGTHLKEFSSHWVLEESIQQQSEAVCIQSFHCILGKKHFDSYEINNLKWFKTSSLNCEWVPYVLPTIVQNARRFVIEFHFFLQTISRMIWYVKGPLFPMTLCTQTIYQNNIVAIKMYFKHTIDSGNFNIHNGQGCPNPSTSFRNAFMF